MLRLSKRLARPSQGLVVQARNISTTVISKTDNDVTFKLPESTFHAYELEPPSLECTISHEQLLEMYQQMSTIRRLEMAADHLYKAKEIRGFCHLSTGQEAIAIGIHHAISPLDSVITSYRCHGFTWLRGASVKEVIAELLGRGDGCSKGRGGSMHMYTPTFYGGNGIVGAQVPLGLGIGFAHQYRNQNAACFTLYGDGAANQGQVFESFNMAKLWNVPVVFACENNKYGMGTSAARASAMTEYYKRGQYIPGLKIDGMDALSCYMGSKFAWDWCVSNKGPLVLEYETYRYGGHSMSDPGTTYRTREEIQQMRSHHDPINGLKQFLLDNELFEEKQLKTVDKEVKAYVDKEVKAAEASAWPDTSPDEFYSDVYVKGSEIPVFRGRIPAENFSFSG